MSLAEVFQEGGTPPTPPGTDGQKKKFPEWLSSPAYIRVYMSPTNTNANESEPAVIMYRPTLGVVSTQQRGERT